jgi:hypothetical protein
MKQVSRLKWRELFIKRQQYIHTEFEHGCECVIDWLAEAEEFYEELGYGSADEMLEKELEIPPDWVRMAAAVLEATGENLSKAEIDHAIELKSHGGDRRSEQAKQHQADNVSLMQHGNSAQYIKAKLKADHPEIAEQLERGEFRSARQAGIAAGIVKDVPTVRMVEPAKAAQSIVQRVGVEFAEQLAVALAEAVAAAHSDLPAGDA